MTSSHLNNFLLDEPQQSDIDFEDQVIIQASGQCDVCHRKLTDPKSIANGRGPICQKKSMSS